MIKANALAACPNNLPVFITDTNRVPSYIIFKNCFSVFVQLLYTACRLYRTVMSLSSWSVTQV